MLPRKPLKWEGFLINSRCCGDGGNPLGGLFLSKLSCYSRPVTFQTWWMMKPFIPLVWTRSVTSSSHLHVTKATVCTGLGFSCGAFSKRQSVSRRPRLVIRCRILCFTMFYYVILCFTMLLWYYDHNFQPLSFILPIDLCVSPKLDANEGSVFLRLMTTRQ